MSTIDDITISHRQRANLQYRFTPQRPRRPARRRSRPSSTRSVRRTRRHASGEWSARRRRSRPSWATRMRRPSSSRWVHDGRSAFCRTQRARYMASHDEWGWAVLLLVPGRLLLAARFVHAPYVSGTRSHQKSISSCTAACVLYRLAPFEGPSRISTTRSDAVRGWYSHLAGCRCCHCWTQSQLDAPLIIIDAI